MSEGQSSISGKYKVFIDLSVIIVILSVVGFYNYNFFHSLAEVFSSMVAMGIFMVAWNSRRYITNYFFLFIGVAYIFIGLLRLLHVITYVQLESLPGTFKDTSDQLWLASLYLFGFSFLIGSFFTKKKIHARTLFIVYAIVVSIILLSIFNWHIFPAVYTNGNWSSSFLNFSKYFLALLILAPMAILHKKREEFDPRVMHLMFYSLLASLIGTELILFKHSDIANSYDLMGHLLYVISAYFFYLGIVEIGLMKPYRLLFKELKDKEKTVSESEELYRSMVESSPDAIIIHNDNGIMYINHSGVNLFGADNAQGLAGKKLRDFIHPDYQSYFMSRMEDLEKGEKKFPLRAARIIGLKGNVTDVEITGRVTNYHGQTAIQSTIRDMSNRTIAIHDAPDPIIMTNTSGKLIYANKAAQRMTGYVWEEMAGNSPCLWGNIFIDDTANKGSSEGRIRYCIWEKINEKNPSFMGEVVNTRKNGEKYIADIHISPIYDDQGNVTFFIAIERDVTKIKELDRAKTEFLSLAAHELRTPLASISLSSELLLRGVGGNLEDKQERYLKEIYASTHRMSELIYTFLNISRIELGTFVVDLSPLDISDCVRETLNDMHMQIEKKKINLQTHYAGDLPITVFDRNVLKIAVQNIIANAIRYSPEGGDVSVEVKRMAAEIVIEISDSGFGIPEGQKTKIFNKSFRADNAKAANAEGLGLGLYIVKSTLEKAGAKIGFESTEGEGGYILYFYTDKK